MSKKTNISEDKIKDALDKVENLKVQIKKRVIGQDHLIKNLLIALFSQSHIILEGVPGLAKTLSIEVLSQTLHLTYRRIQFTPDLLPSDLIGSRIYNQQTGEFYTKKGPIFANFILTDEINRAPSKVQSALLEAMQEKQVSIGEDTFRLESPFIVLATQNPLEQEGTYALPEAQVDRFLLKTIIDYPDEDQEVQIMKNEVASDYDKIERVMNKKDIESVQQIVSQIHVSEEIYNYVKDIVFATRNPEKYGIKELSTYLGYGASPRASISLVKAAKVNAFLSGKDYVSPDDIKDVSFDVLRHRLIPSYEAIAEDITSDDIVAIVMDNVNTP